MRTRLVLAGMLGIVVCWWCQTAEADDRFRIRTSWASGQDYVPGEFLVKFKPSVSDALIPGLLARHQGVLLSTSRFAAFHRLRVPAGRTVAEMVERFRQDSNVEYAEPNYLAYASWVPNDEFYRYQWHLDNPQHGGIQSEEAWDVSAGDPGVIVAVVDTGVAYEDYTQTVRWSTRQYYRAPDLAQTLFVAGYDYVNDDPHPNDDEGHGTHVTGTIAQSTNNGIGTAGVAFQCKIMPVKVLDSRGSGTYADVADGIRFAADNGADVINLSLGGSSASSTLQQALAYAQGKGATIVCASGNNGSATTLSYPAAYEECLAVGATRYDETVTSYSNRGAGLDLVAPGGDVTVDQNLDGYGDGVLQQTFGNATNDWGYWFYQGTSMATPHVSGVAALVIARGIATSPAEVRQVLQATAEDKGLADWDSTYGHGLVNAAAALAASASNQAPVAVAGPDRSAVAGQAVSFDGTGSNDPDGSIVSHQWNFGDGNLGSGAVVSHAYATAGLYTVTLTVTDDEGLTNSDSAVVTVTETSVPVEVFTDSFEVGEWNGLWTEDSQNDWYRSSQRAMNGTLSAEVDGLASDAQLISKSINLQGFTSATVTFSWLIEQSLDAGEYLAFDVSTNGGTTWSERARLRANVDPEGIWHPVSVNVANLTTSLRLRFRGKMSSSIEDANVDHVRVVAQ